MALTGTERTRRWYVKNVERAKAAQALWKRNNPERVKEKRSKWRKENKEKIRKNRKLWRKMNPGKVSESNKKSRRKTGGKLNANVATAISRALNGNKKGWHWEDLVGYTHENLKIHLEKQFNDGMSWDNYGKGGWEIDHRIPIAAFNIETPFDLDFRQCWALRNLRPMWAKDNRSKKDKLTKPHQPSLLL